MALTTMQGTGAEGAPVVSEYIVKKIPVPVRDFISPPNMIVIWSFDVNKLAKVDEIRGGFSWCKYSRGTVLRLPLESPAFCAVYLPSILTTHLFNIFPNAFKPKVLE
ncbi:hypothetical protein Vadar_003087 [Vaccinium darrowii]|uniref:Uncharacterized protein n=1 Tax=Vaccinium darrowii TaxID=229202 RepID=A0ACB7XMR9_9ERIC|nr:hypothetical protein Vadar_003087 [Vaccinium darrowii]